MEIETILLLCAIFFFFSIIGLLILMYHKLSKLIDKSAKQNLKLADNTFAQIEALMAIYAEIDLVHGLPTTRGWAASPDFLHFLIQYVAENKPRVIVECSSGVSTLVMAACLKKQGFGKIYSLEHDAVFAEKTKKLLNLYGLENWAIVINAPLKELQLDEWLGDWYDISSLGEDILIDMLVVDGPPYFVSELARFPALPVFYDRLRQNAVVLLDDANREAEQQIVSRYLNKYKEFSLIPYLRAEKGIAAFQRTK